MRFPVIPPMLVALVQEAFTAVDGTVFATCSGTCPDCGGKVTGYDTRERQFARIAVEMGKRTIRVTVKRFRCVSCGKIVNADEPFYPGTKTGAPVIDLCIAFSQQFGYGRAARRLSTMGIAVDRMQCRHYAMLPVRPFRILQMYGHPLPQSVLSLSLLTATLPEGSRIEGAEALAACGFPSAGRAALHRPPAGEERDEGDNEERYEERDPKKPEDDGKQEGSGEEDKCKGP